MDERKADAATKQENAKAVAAPGREQLREDRPQVVGVMVHRQVATSMQTK